MMRIWPTAGAITLAALLAPGAVVQAEDTAAPRLSAILANFKGHEPFYALLGDQPTNLKLQFSFRYRLFGDGAEPSDEPCGRPGNVYFGMTMTGFWNLEAKSKPFEDTNYKPELMIACTIPAGAKRGLMPRVRWQAALRHESNGKAGTDSRSLNKLYLEPGLEWGEPGARNLVIRLTPRVWTYVGDLSENPDIGDWLGHAALGLSIARNGDWKLAVARQFGDTSGRGNVVVDAAVWPKAVFASDAWPNFYLHAQLFHGYGESLLNYRNDFLKRPGRKSTRLRVGLSIVP